MNACENCKHWDIANAAPSLGGSIDEYTLSMVDELDPNDEYDAVVLRKLRLPHANQNWSKCAAAMEGWEDEFDASKHKMAVWDGSRYMASLLTRCDHVCGQHETRTAPDTAEGSK